MSYLNTQQRKPSIFLFSSNYLPLYLQNMLNILALPHGAINRVRYDERWVSPQFQRQAEETATDWDTRLQGYIGKTALIILLGLAKDKDPDEQVDSDLRFFPLRYVIITRFEWDGDVLYVHFKVGGYVDWRCPNERELRDLITTKLEVRASRTTLVADFIKHIKELKFYGSGLPVDLVRPHNKASGEFEATLLPAVDKALAGLPSGTPAEEREAIALHELASMIGPFIARCVADEFDYIVKELASDLRPQRTFASLASDRPIQIPIVPEAESAEGWQAIVEVLGSPHGLRDYDNTVYYRLVEVVELQSPDLIDRLLRRSPQAASASPTGRTLAITQILDENGYKLLSNHNYALTLSFYQSNALHDGSLLTYPVRGSKIVPVVDKTYFGIPPEEIEVNFHYDTRSIHLVVASLTQEVVTAFTTELEAPPAPALPSPVAPAAQAQLYAPELDLRFRIGVPGSIWIWLVVLFLAQILASTPTVVKWIPGFAQLGDDGIKVLGSALSALTIFFLYRRLPTGGK
jgi:hypothetical protein